MLTFINNKNGVPIYDQIYSQIKAQIINGTLEEDAPLPSIRNLAKDLHISVITTKRAYEELERNGLIYTAPAKAALLQLKIQSFCVKKICVRLKHTLMRL